VRRALPLAALACLIAVPALAHPVPIGRYAQIPYGVSPAHPHPTEGGGAARTGRLRGVAPATEPRRLWERNLPQRRLRGPTLAADGTLYLGTMGGLSAVAPDGTERWSVRLGAVPGAPSIAPSGDVAVVTRGGLVALVSPEGVVRRTADLGAPARGSLLVLDDGSVVVGTLDRRVHRLDASLRPVFETELADGSASTLALTARGALAVASGRFLSLLSPTGGITRQVTLGGRASAPPSVADDGTLWVPTVEGVLHAIEPGGRIRSRTELGSRHYDGAAPAIGPDGAVRVPTMSEGVVCVGAGGTERWRFPSPAGFNAPISVDAAGTTLAVDRGGRLFAIDETGVERWRVVIGTHTYQAPVLAADGTLYVVTEQGALHAYR